MGQFVGHNFMPADILASDNENEIEAYLANPFNPYTKLGKKILGSLQQFGYKTKVAFQSKNQRWISNTQAKLSLA